MSLGTVASVAPSGLIPLAPSDPGLRFAGPGLFSKRPSGALISYSFLHFTDGSPVQEIGECVLSSLHLSRRTRNPMLNGAMNIRVASSMAPPMVSNPAEMVLAARSRIPDPESVFDWGLAWVLGLELAEAGFAASVAREAAFLVATTGSEAASGAA